MKTTFILAATIASLASGYSISSELRENAAYSPMKFVGPAFVDGPNVTLTGTAESIFNELHKLNPNYNAWDFPEYRAKMAAMGVEQAPLRDRVECNPSGVPVPNWNTQCSAGLNYLSQVNGYCHAPPGPGGCTLVSCSNNCGISLCNDNVNTIIGVFCAQIADDARLAGNTCQQRAPNSPAFSAKGQVFRDQSPKWNVVLKSC